MVWPRHPADWRTYVLSLKEFWFCFLKVNLQAFTCQNIKVCYCLQSLVLVQCNGTKNCLNTFHIHNLHWDLKGSGVLRWSWIYFLTLEPGCRPLFSDFTGFDCIWSLVGWTIIETFIYKKWSKYLLKLWVYGSQYACSLNCRNPQPYFGLYVIKRHPLQLQSRIWCEAARIIDFVCWWILFIFHNVLRSFNSSSWQRDLWLMFFFFLLSVTITLSYFVQFWGFLCKTPGTKTNVGCVLTWHCCIHILYRTSKLMGVKLVHRSMSFLTI